MTVHVPLSPHLQAFVREQLASGRFESESDLIQTALLMLQENTRSQEGLRNGAAERVGTRLGNEPHDRLGAGQISGKDALRKPLPRRSPRGILGDIRSYISPDDIKEARHEMWAGFPHGEA